MRALLLLLLLPFLPQPASPPPNSLSPEESADGWILLFDGQSLSGWTKDGLTDWRVVDGTIVGEGNQGGWLRTNSAFSDYLLKCEFRTGGNGASGIVLSSGKQGGYQLPTAKGKLAGGQWHLYEVAASAKGFTVKLDGKRIAGGKETGAVGSIGLEHIPENKVEYRSIKLKPLGLRPIFDAKDLNGWRKVEAPKAKEPAVWSAKDGAIHVEKGPGQLETGSQYQDFLLQLDVRTNAPDKEHHPNSGVFFRGTPNSFWSGYEAQIRNQYKDDDRNQPVDFGTGGIYGRQPARKVVSNDDEWFMMTITARGRHMAVWVNGYPVSDWTDPNPEGDAVRKDQAKVTAGPISLQAHDPTTNLDFRNIRIEELPAPK